MTAEQATPLSRGQIAWRAAQDIAEGAYVNLGLGIPTLAANHVPAGREVIFHSENGLLGFGPAAPPETADADLVDASGTAVTLLAGAALFDSADAFVMMRGGHLDLTLLGAFQVSASGDIANWDAEQPGRAPLIGGAMDLVSGAREVRVLMAHTTTAGAPRLVRECTYPLTGTGVVRRIYTDLAVLDVTADGFRVSEIIAGLDFGDLRRRTAAPLAIADDWRILGPPALSDDGDPNNAKPNRGDN